MSIPKRVLHFQGRMGRGGAESFMMNAFRRIDRSKYVFDFVIYEDYRDVTPYHDEIKELGGNIYVVPNPNTNIFSYIKAVKTLFRKEHFDIVHNEIFFGGGINLYLAKKAGINKRVAHSHATTDGKGNKFPYNIVRPFLKKLLMNNATDYLACSHEAGLGLFGNNHPFIEVPNGIDLNLYSSENKNITKFKSELNLPKDSFVVGHIGRFEEQKNHMLLIDIFADIVKRNDNAYLIAIGEGSLKNSIVKKAQSMNIADHILFLGERDDIPNLLSVMDVFVMPSLYEGLPMVAVEAQAANLKLVLSNEISPDTVLSENVQFLPLDAGTDKWAATILEEPHTNKPLPEMKKFDFNYTAKMLEDTYSN